MSISVRVHTFLWIGLLNIPTYFFGQKPLPQPYSSTIKLNFVRTWDALVPEPNPNTLMLRPVNEVKQVTEYLDGLGRPIQSVIKNGSLTSVTGVDSDMILPVVYNGFGIEQNKYLPFASTATDATRNNGLFKLNPFQQQVGFYNTQLAGQVNETNVGAGGLNWAYSETIPESSPLNRTTQQFFPGSSWVGTVGNALETDRRSIKSKYLFNTDVDYVLNLVIENSGTIGVFGTYKLSPNYVAGTLFKHITIDENNKQVVEFKDKEGKIILKKAQLTAEPDNGNGSAHAGWLCTYYIYDISNNLRCVIQPRGVEHILSSGDRALALAEQCFLYEYDARNRMIMKKVPGVPEVLMVYDARDRLVMTQDAYLRSQNKWMVILYDEFNRPVQTGLVTNSYFFSKPFSQHLSDAASSINYPFTTASTPATSFWEYLTKTGYDDYSTIPTASGLNKTYDGSWNAHLVPQYNIAPLYAREPLPAVSTKGMVTWTETKVLNANSFLYTVNIYDRDGRILQVKSKNHTGGIDVQTTQYNWMGAPLIRVQKNEKPIVPAQTTVVVTKLTYDLLNRLVKTDKKLSNTLVNGNAMSSYKTISENQYDALGQLKTKKLAPAFNSNTGLESIAYDYNVRGWLLGANRLYARDGINTNYFGFDLGYDKINNNLVGGQTYLQAQYDGNIAGMVWKSKGDGEKRKYDYNYDAISRIIKADFNQYNGGTFNKNAKVDFSMVMGDGLTANTAYDANGNIRAMKQWGLKLNASQVIDELTYTYNNNGVSNKLQAVTESTAINSLDQKLGDFTDKNRTLDDYTYDLNGNMILDKNKGIVITYNHLNLPNVVNVAGKGSITYTYDAAGSKLKKVTVENASAANNNITTSTTTNYLGGAVFESKTDNNAQTTDYIDRLQFIAHEEGRIRFKPADNSFQYDYMLKDHLGNIRMVLTEEQQVDKYPVASLEPSKIQVEKNYYSIVDVNVVPAPAGMPSPAYTNDNGIGNNPVDATFSAATSTKMYSIKANSSTVTKTGLGITLKVMAGDRIDVFGRSYWKMPAGTSTITTTPFALSALELMNALVSTSTVISAGKNVTGSVLNTINSTLMTAGTNGFFNNQPTQSTLLPKAFINYIFFDENFNYVGGGFSRVGSSGTLKDHITEMQNKVAAKNGFIYIYCSNESQVEVFFDNLQVRHTRSPILEETHYYPFGLTMAGISAKSAGSLKNAYGITSKELQDKEFIDGAGLGMYDFGARFQDPQIGRWHSIDPMVSNYYWVTPYNYCNNNPIKYIDPNGMEFKDTLGGRHDVETLQNVTVKNHPKKNNTLADRAFPWVRSMGTPAVKTWTSRFEVYQQARFDGWGQDALKSSWLNKGVGEDDLEKFEKWYQAEVEYRNAQLIAVGILGAPFAVTAVVDLELVSSLITASRVGSEAISNTTVHAAVLTNLGKNAIVTTLKNEILLYTSAQIVDKLANSGYAFTVNGNHIAALLDKIFDLSKKITYIKPNP